MGASLKEETVSGYLVPLGLLFCTCFIAFFEKKVWLPMFRRLFPLLMLLGGLVMFVFFNTTVRAFCSEAVYPFWRVTAWVRGQVSDRFSAAWRGLCDGPSARDAAEEVERLTVMVADYGRVEQENADLRKALGWVEAQSHRVVAARVWSHGGGVREWPRLTLAAGSRRGIRPGDTVVVPEGLVGRVTDEISAHTCVVMLISDPGCRVAAEVPGVAKGVLFGAEGSDYGRETATDGLYTVAPLKMRYVARGIRVPPNARVLTEGSGRLFPRGIPVGTVLESHDDPKSGVLTELSVIPSADPALLDTVFVLTSGTPPEGMDVHAR